MSQWSSLSLAEHCGYEALHDEMIRDRIVVGIQDRKPSERCNTDLGENDRNCPPGGGSQKAAAGNQRRLEG